MTFFELKKTLIQKMQTLYPATESRSYGVEVVEGYAKPAFFTQLKPITMDFANRNSTENVLAFYITYFQKQVDEADMLRKIDGIRELFGSFIRVGDRAVDVSGFSFDYAGNDRNILEVSFDLEFFGKLEREVDAEMIGAVVTATEIQK